MNTPTEYQVINRMRQGDGKAFTTVVENYQAAIQRFILRMTGDYHLTQDLAQDTFIRAYNGIIKTHSELSLKAWLYRIASNVVYAHYRRKRLILFVPFTEAMKDGPLDPGSLSQNNEESIVIGNALRKVSYDKRVCLVLHYVDGFKYREIAGILGISEDAVRKRVARGTDEFRILYKKEGGEKR